MIITRQGRMRVAEVEECASRYAWAKHLLMGHDMIERSGNFHLGQRKHGLCVVW